MSGVQPPPPGWQPPDPEPSAPRWGQPPPAGGWPAYQPGGAAPPGQAPPYPVPYPVLGPAAHKPGAIPLRPLTLSDFFDGAFRIIRYNPRATVGAAVLVSAVAMVVPVVIGLASGSALSFGGLDSGDQTLTDSQIVSLLVTLGGVVVGAELQSIGLLFVSGMIAHVTSAAAVGRRLTMAEAWAATRGKRWRLLGMAFLLGLGTIAVAAVAAATVVFLALVVDASVGVVVLVSVVWAVVLVVGYVLFLVRMRTLAVPTLMLEPVGVFGALRRSVRLSRQQFWRLFGLILLVGLVAAVAGGILQAPFSIAGQVFLTTSAQSGQGLLIYLLLSGLGTVVSSAVLQPFESAVYALMYVDQRIRKEAFDVELLARAGILTG